QDSDYREANDFFFLTGLESPGGVLVLIQPDSGRSAGEVMLFLNAPPPVPDRVSAPRTAADSPGAAPSGLPPVHARRPKPRRRAPVDPMIALVDSLATARGLERIANPRRVIAPLRAVKDADELRRLRRASDISVEAHKAAMRGTRPGMWEYEAEAIVEY